MPHRHDLLLAVIFGLGAGLVSMMFFSADVLAPAVLVAAAAALAAAAASGRAARLLLTAVFVSAFAVGAWRTEQVTRSFATEFFPVGEKITFQATVVKEPRRTERSLSAVVELRRCRDEKGGDCSGRRLLLKTSPYEKKVFLRAVLSGECRPERPRNFTPDFDYVSYLRARGVVAVCRPGDLRSLRPQEFSDRVYAALVATRFRAEEILRRFVSGREGSLAAGILFGGDERLSEDVREKFKAVGLTHIVAVSGYNVTVIAQYILLLGILLGLSRATAVWPAVIGVTAFVAMIGFPPPATRAAIMGLIALFLMRVGRVSAAWLLLSAAAVVMLWRNPLLARYDIGFQLSFLATTGIIFVYPLLERIFARRSRVGSFWRELILLTLSAQIFVLPVLIYNFQTFSTVSLPANIFVLPVIPAVMALAFLTITVGAILPPLGAIFGFLTKSLLSYVFVAVEFFAASPAAMVSAQISASGATIFYLAVLSAVYLLRRR
ncbi:MAG TPA: ComEC family competence protein, partial [Candidatus Moranbacteria bacterium]|nr:ComEC family competence protein [Candidatus Moranbacteria bacterium]